jgi:hypothetical protein
MSGDSINSFNGWKPTAHLGRWLDDVLTSKSITPYQGKLVLCDKTNLPIYATDHNGVRANLSYKTEVLP